MLYRIALATASMVLLTPAAAAACDLDGIDEMHRMNPFAGMGFGRGAPVPPPPSMEPNSARTELTNGPGDRSAKEKTESLPLPVRKWAQQGDGAPVSAADSGTFT